MTIRTKSGKTSDSGVDWEKASTELTRRCAFVQIYGETSTGRTSLALTAPGPIALLHASEKLEGVVQKYAGDKDIELFNFGGTFTGTVEAIARQASEVMAEVKAAWEDAFTWARTVVIDTHTELWELLRLARFGKLTQIKPYHYGPVNAEWRSMFRKFRSQDRCNLIAIGQIREKYKGDKPTGRMEQAGQKEMPYMADVIVQTNRNSDTFKAKVEKAWWNAHMEGLVLEDDMVDFGTILGIVTETDPEEWL